MTTAEQITEALNLAAIELARKANGVTHPTPAQHTRALEVLTVEVLSGRRGERARDVLAAAIAQTAAAA